VKTDGTFWGMGWNQFGQLGDGTTIDQNSPVQIDSNVSSVTARGSHSLFVKTDGTLWTMGRNSYGQLGDGTTTDRNSSVQIDSNVSSVTAGGSHSLYVKTDGTLWAMGWNAYGQLGDGTNVDRSSPLLIETRIPDLNDSDGDGLSNYSEIILGTDPNLKNTDLFTYVTEIENEARSEGNTSGVLWVQENPARYYLYTENELNASMENAKSAGIAEANATIQSDLARKGLSMVTYSNQVDFAKPYTNTWFYQPGMGWLWTNNNTFPFFYCMKDYDSVGTWLYFSQLNDQKSAYFYDYSTQVWIDANTPTKPVDTQPK